MPNLNMEDIDKEKLAIALVTSAYFIYYCLTYQEPHFINNVNLLIHESGHVIFMAFGKFMHFLGGSLFQVLFPGVFVFYFYKNKDYFSASLLLFWVGQNLLDVSVYASDAIAMELPLLGGEHDWNTLLDMTNTLQYTKSIGTAIYACGIFVILCAICLSIINSINKPSEEVFTENN